MTRSQRIHRIILCSLFLLFSAFHTIADARYIRDKLAAFYKAKHSPKIDAEVISSAIDRQLIFGTITFVIDYKPDERCTTRAFLGRESDHLKFKTGSVIQIVPRSGCENPIVATGIRPPIFEIIGILFWMICFALIAREVIKEFR